MMNYKQAYSFIKLAKDKEDEAGPNEKKLREEAGRTSGITAGEVALPLLGAGAGAGIGYLLSKYRKIKDKKKQLLWTLIGGGTGLLGTQIALDTKFGDKSLRTMFREQEVDPEKLEQARAEDDKLKHPGFWEHSAKSPLAILGGGAGIITGAADEGILSHLIGYRAALKDIKNRTKSGREPLRKIDVAKDPLRTRLTDKWTTQELDYAFNKGEFSSISWKNPFGLKNLLRRGGDALVTGAAGWGTGALADYVAHKAGVPDWEFGDIRL